MPLKPPSPCHPGLSLQLSLLGREKMRERKKLNKEKERNVLLSQASDRTQTLGKETRAGEKKEFPKKRRFFIAVLVNKSDL